MIENIVNMPPSPTYIITAGELAGLTRKTVTTVLAELAALPQHTVYTLPNGKIAIPPGLVKVYLASQGVDYRFTVIAHINLKGGTGKTTTAITSATRAAQYGFNTCILDLDSQASASVAFDRAAVGDEAIFDDVWQRPAETVRAALKKIDAPLYLLPSSLDNSILDTNLNHPALQQRAVKGVCDELQRQGFNLVVIDCPPSLGAAVISTVCAANLVVIPVNDDIFSLRGLDAALQEIAAICRSFQIPTPDIKILYTKFDRRISSSVETFEELAAAYPEQLIPAPIRTSSHFTRALKYHATVFASSRHSPAKDDYDAYVRHVLGFPESYKD